MAQPASTIAQLRFGARCESPVTVRGFLFVEPSVINFFRAFSGRNSVSCHYNKRSINTACIVISPATCPANLTGRVGSGHDCLDVVIAPPCPAISACPFRAAKRYIAAFWNRSFFRSCLCLCLARLCFWPHCMARNIYAQGQVNADVRD